MTMEDVKMLRGTDGTKPVELPDIILGKESPVTRESRGRQGRQTLSAAKSAPNFGVRRKMKREQSPRMPAL
jgi:hypothetical protein